MQWQWPFYFIFLLGIVRPRIRPDYFFGRLKDLSGKHAYHHLECQSRTLWDPGWFHQMPPWLRLSKVEDVCIDTIPIGGKYGIRATNIFADDCPRPLLPSLISKMVEPNNTFRVTRMVVLGTLFLIEPCGTNSHRFSVGATSLFSLIVIILGFALTNSAVSVGNAIFCLVSGILTLPILFV